MKVTLTTPFEMAKKVSATVQHKEARAGSFFNQLEAEYNGKNMNVATTWDVTSGYDLKVLTINPWKNFNTNINFVGESFFFFNFLGLIRNTMICKCIPYYE